MNVEQIAKSLKLKKRGLADGAQNIPSADESAQDEVTRRVDAVLADIIDKRREQTRERVREISGWIGSIMKRLDAVYTNLQRIENAGLNRMYDAVTEGYNRLRYFHREYLAAHKSLHHFKSLHKLERVPHYPQSNVWNWGVLTLIFSMEVAVNGFTLQDVHPEGFIGIITAMFMISFINITVGLGAGFVYRYTNHYRWFHRQFGLVSAATLMLVLLLFNCLVGHWRNALVSVEADISIFSFDIQLGVRLLDNFLHNPLLLSDFKSYLMAIVGFIFGCISAWKAYNWEDPYPGYAHAAMVVDDYSGQYRQELENNRYALKMIKDETVEAVVSLGNGFDGDHQLVLDYRQEIKDIKQGYLDFIALAHRNGNYLYDFYRRINMKKRTDPLPPCFDIKYSVPAEMNTIAVEMEEEVKQTTWRGDLDVHELSQKLERKIADIYKEYAEIYGLIDSVEVLNQKMRGGIEKKIQQIHQRFRGTQAARGQDGG